MCRWVSVALVGIYLIAVIGLLIATLLIIGWRLPEAARWLMVAGWIGLCFGKVALEERLLPVLRSSCRRPVLAEEQRLDGAMRSLLERAGCKTRVKFLVEGDPARRDRSIGYGTILLQSASLQWASDQELQGMLAVELGYLRDGERVLEEVFRAAGLFSWIFRAFCRVLRSAFRLLWPVGLVLAVLLSLGLLLALPFFLLEAVVGLLRRILRRWIVFRQDEFAFSIGCGDGLRAWLEKSGLGAHAERIRRLEQLAGLR